ncbi:17718_t:CDS:2, partial [Racocetra fulgida]
MANNFESGNNLVSATLRTKLNSFDISIPNPVRRLPLFINHAQSTALKKKLQDQLNENTAQIQLTADLNAALAKRRLELERQIKELDKIEFNEIPQGLGNNLIDVEKPTAFSTTSSGRGSRRDRNTAKGHQIGIEFATEIGQGLLQEVRRLQTLLHEKEAITKGLEAEKAELERTLNEQIWALELAKLDLNAQLEDSQQQLSKSRSNYAKIEKALSTATD